MKSVKSSVIKICLTAHLKHQVNVHNIKLKQITSIVATDN